jgi:glycosyltransferase involved in cell wall biosynthesis
MSSNLGRKVIENRKLDDEETKHLQSFDVILSINNLGSKSLSHSKTKVVRQIHTVASDRPVSSYLSLNPGVVDYLKMYFQKHKEMSRERALSGVGTVCVSQYNLRKMQAKKLEASNNLVQIPNGISIADFKPVKQVKKFDILFIGRFQKLKGLDLLLRSISLLSLKNKYVIVGIIGSFSTAEQNFCLRLVPEKIRKYIQFQGMVKHEEVPKFINSARLVVVPSCYESFSLPSLEAIACGVPIVAFSVGGIPEIVNRENGILVEKIDSSKLATSIEKALQSEDLAQSAMLSGPRKAMQYDIGTVTRNLVKYLNSKVESADPES